MTSIVTLFTRKSPTISGIEFDAVLEDTFDLEVVNTTFVIEAGATAVDHRVIQPIRWSLVGAVSNNPLRVSATDFVGGLSNFVPGGLAGTVAGLASGFLAGSEDTRASSALEQLILMATSGESFDVDAGDIQLPNMVIDRIRRTKNPENEDALIFIAELRELPTLDTLTSVNSNPKQSQLRDGDPAKTQAAEQIDRGEQGLQISTPAINTQVLAVTG